MYNRILVPTDGSPGAAAAIDFALDLLITGVGKSVTLLHIASISKEISSFSIINTKPVEDEMIKSNLIHHGHHLLLNSKTLFEQKGLAVDTLVELSDDPGDKIIKIAQEKNFDLIIIGRRGLSVMKELMLGSVSSYVLHHAECPVVIYKA